MSIKNTIRTLTIIAGIFLLLFLVGCKSTGTDEAQITQIAKNIEEAIEEKDVDLFMENISYNYSDAKGGTYDNHINNLPEEIFSKIELIEALLDPISGLKVATDVSLSNLIITDPYATEKMKITISLKYCFLFCVPFPSTDEVTTEYNVDFIKEDEDWKIISMEEI